MAEYCLKPSVTIAEIQSNQSMTPEKKALLISALSNGIITDAPLYPTLTHYNATKKDTQEFFSSPGYLQAEKMVIQVTGEKTSTQADTELLVQKISEDPVSALSGKPITTIAAGIAIIIGLGYEGKGKGFSFWTGLKRGFIGIIALFLGNAVAKEWGMDPKKLLKEGVDMVKDGGKKAGDAAVGLTSGAPGVVD